MPAGLAHAAGVGADLHALGDRHRAGGGQVLRAFHLDDADAAGADGLQPLDVAQRGDADAGLAGRVQDRGALGNFDGDVVDGQLDHGRSSTCLLPVIRPVHSCTTPSRHWLASAVRRAPPSVVAAQAAAGLAHGDRFAPRLLDFVEVVAPPLDGDQLQMLARRIRRFGVRIEEGVDLVQLPPEGVFVPVR